MACPARGGLDIALGNSEGIRHPTPNNPTNGAILPSTQPSTTTVSPKELAEAVEQAMEERIQAQSNRIPYYLDA